MRSPYSIFTRRNTKGKKYFCIRFFDTSGKVIRTISLPKTITSRLNAVREAERLYAKGIVSQEQNPFVYEYLQAFWKPDSDYAEGKRLRGSPLSASYLKLNQLAIKRAKPFLEKKRILDITPTVIERMILELSRSGIHPRLINVTLQSVTVPLNYFFRTHGIPNPLKAVITRVKENPKERGTLTIQELKALITIEDVAPQVYAGVLLGALCGLRIGECLGLTWEDVDEKQGILNIRQAFNPLEGVKHPKWNSVRQVPAPEVVLQALRRCRETAPWESPTFILWNTRTPHRPVGRDTVQRGFMQMLHRIGIDEAQRVERNLTFHGLRHTYVSLSRAAGVPDFIVQRIVGHKSVEMTEGYTHATVVDFLSAKQKMESALKVQEMMP